MRKSVKKLLSLFLVTLMVCSLGVTAFAAEEPENPLYVCIGDSNAAGYNLPTFVENRKPVPDAYHCKVAEGLDMDLITYATGGYRTDEVLYMIDPTFEMDWYYGENLSHGHNKKEDLDPYKEAYVQAIKDADVLSIQVGSNDVMGEQLGLALMHAFETPKIDGVIEKLNGLGAVGKLPASGLGIVKVVVMIATFAPKFVIEMAQRIKDGNKEFAEQWDRMIGRIYELNPDVQIVALDVLNSMGRTSLFVGEKFKIGKYLGFVFNGMNKWIASGSKYADKYIFVEIADITGADLAVLQKDFGDAYLKQCHPDADGHTEIANRIIAAVKEANKKAD